MESLSKCDHLDQIYLSYVRTMEGPYRAHGKPGSPW